MKIAILGTRGIPNNYGGFEEFAEYISVELSGRGHDVTVYNPDYHPFNDSNYNGVKITKKYYPEGKIGNIASFFYDFLCLKDALKNKFDIILECGYGSVAVSYLFLPIKKSLIFTNMDGMEWQRGKWNFFAKKILKISEKIAVKKSHYIISDNTCVQGYYKAKYQKESFYIPYGALPVNNYNEKILKKYNINKNNYFLIVARLEPENNIRTIINGIIESGVNTKILIISNPESRFGKRTLKKFQLNKNVIFLGSIYDIDTLNSLRYYSKAYFHGHSIGGTNPSLLEAMACKCLIISHDNIFNKSVLDDDALFFTNSNDIKNIILNFDSHEQKREEFSNKNLDKIRKKYNWKVIADKYESIFSKSLK